MDPITLRLPDDLLDKLDAEAAERGFSTRSEYIRWLLKHRHEAGPNTSDAGPATTDYDQQLEAIENRVRALEDELEQASTSRRSPSGESGGRQGAESINSAVARVVANISESWDDDETRLAARREAARAALKLAVERGSLGRTAATETLLPEYEVDGQNEETWWRKNVKPVLSAVGEYSRGNHEYNVNRENLKKAS